MQSVTCKNDKSAYLHFLIITPDSYFLLYFWPVSQYAAIGKSGFCGITTFLVYCLSQLFIVIIMLQWHTLSTVNLQALCAESMNGNKTDSFLVLVNSDLVQKWQQISPDNY